jgi:hypothetical protein
MQTQTHTYTRAHTRAHTQVGSIEAMDAAGSGAGLPMLLVDVRTQEEVDVSSIPGSIHCPAVQEASMQHGWCVLRVL